MLVKILVADDSKTNLSLITASLQKLGHTVVAASSGHEALHLFKNDRPDLIILDVVMGEMNGFECAKEIRKIDQEDWIPIIFLSASVDDNSIAQGIAAGGDDYLTKPCSEITLEAKIKAMQRISEMRKKLFETSLELKILSSTDIVTGIYNRFEFERRIKEKLAESDRYHHTLALLFIDLDHFKNINDSLGHHIGDLLLIEVAKRLKASLRIDDFIARFGGDEFVIIISHITNQNSVEVVAKNIIAKLAPVYDLQGHHIKISASIGVAFYPFPSTSHISFLQNADVAMYHAKELGRNNFQIYSEELNKKYKQQISLEHELKFALEKNELYLVYQPICNLLTKKTIGMEVLLRWQHAKFGLIPPSNFIPIAEEMGLINQMGNWVLRNACLQGAKWRALGVKNFKLSINIASHQLLEDNFFEIMKEILKETKFPPQSLELELTESTIISNTKQLQNILRQLTSSGISISIDDFGKRYSFLTSLKFLPISTFKIDKVFIEDVCTDSKNSVIVKSLIELGSGLNLNVIAEGIETEEQRQFLITNGCFTGQGYLLNKPLAAEEITALLKGERKTEKEEPQKIID